MAFFSIMGYAAKKEKISPELYLELERKAEFKSELINGEMYAMVGTTRKHNRIAGNLYIGIDRILKSRPCKVYISDLRVQINSTGLFTYPDLIITCGKEILTDKHKDTLTNPKCIIEVLSDSTEKYDRGEKFFNYQQIESLEEYILVSQDQNRVETFLRQTDGKWLYQCTEGLDSKVRINTAEESISLSEIYSNTEDIED
ncbi:MAG TPA: Uma2 family endonuclease [Leptospiraceae bacterium]|nr:Uma2 family endonuclease [Leptospiraceae bacterium]